MYDFDLTDNKKLRLLTVLSKFQVLDSIEIVENVGKISIERRSHDTLIVNKCKYPEEIITFLKSRQLNKCSKCTYIIKTDCEITTKKTYDVKDPQFFFKDIIANPTEYLSEKMMIVAIDNKSLNCQKSIFYPSFVKKSYDQIKNMYPTIEIDNKKIQTNIQFGCGNFIHFHLDEYNLGTVSLLDNQLSPGVIKIWILYVRKYNVMEFQFLFSRFKNLNREQTIDYLDKLSEIDLKTNYRIVLQYPGNVIEFPSNVGHFVITGIMKSKNKMGMSVLTGINNCTCLKAVCANISNPIDELNRIHDISDVKQKLTKFIPLFEEVHDDQFVKHEQLSIQAINGHKKRKMKLMSMSKSNQSRDKNGKFSKI